MPDAADVVNRYSTLLINNIKNKTMNTGSYLHIPEGKTGSQPF